MLRATTFKVTNGAMTRLWTRKSEEREQLTHFCFPLHWILVSDCSPSLPDLETHLQYLNDTRDFYGFLKRIRKAFIEFSKK